MLTGCHTVVCRVFKIIDYGLAIFDEKYAAGRRSAVIPDSEANHALAIPSRAHDIVQGIWDQLWENPQVGGCVMHMWGDGSTCRVRV
jgi:hypothetical protein